MNVFRIIKLADGFTLLNAVFGFCAMLMAFHGNQQGAAILIIFAAAADGIDGFLARKFGSGPLGANLDSLADLISFGVAPSFLALTSFDYPQIAWLAGIFYLIAGTLRLARFNISNKNDSFFEGLPIPAAGIALSASVLLAKPIFTLTLMILLGMLMVSSVSYPKIRDLRIMSLLGLLFLFAAFLIWQQNDIIYGSLLLISMIVIYLGSPVVISRLRKGK
jgi:archaetidylserine synthase